MKWLKRKVLGIVIRSVADEVKNAKDKDGKPKFPFFVRFMDLLNEMSLTEALNAVGSEFNWPASNGLGIDRLAELGAHLGEYGDMWRKAIRIFQRAFNRPNERRNAK